MSDLRTCLSDPAGKWRALQIHPLLQKRVVMTKMITSDAMVQQRFMLMSLNVTIELRCKIAHQGLSFQVTALFVFQIFLSII